MRASLVLTLAALAGGGCVGRTGGDTVTFAVAAAGPADAKAGQPLSFSSSGFDVVLTRATLHVGAVYLDESIPVSGAQATGCYLTGAYVAEETSALTVDLLSATAQRFPSPALGITDPAPLIGEAWLTGGDVNAATDETAILTVAGTATRNGTAFPFTGTVTIGSNRQPPSAGRAAGTPICKARIVSLIPARLTLQKTGGLLLRIDPRTFFEGVDFSELPPDPKAGGFLFPDEASVPAAQKLYVNLHSYAAYAFSWSEDL
jgi:hypothetical protein